MLAAQPSAVAQGFPAKTMIMIMAGRIRWPLSPNKDVRTQESQPAPLIQIGEQAFTGHRQRRKARVEKAIRQVIAPGIQWVPARVPAARRHRTAPPAQDAGQTRS